MEQTKKCCSTSREAWATFGAPPVVHVCGWGVLPEADIIKDRNAGGEMESRARAGRNKKEQQHKSTSSLHRWNTVPKSVEPIQPPSTFWLVNGALLKKIEWGLSWQTSFVPRWWHKKSGSMPVVSEWIHANTPAARSDWIIQVSQDIQVVNQSWSSVFQDLCGWNNFF